MSFPLPSPHWQWHFDQNEEHLCLSIGEQGILKTALCKKTIRDTAFCFGGFSVSDTDTYQHFFEILESGPLFQNLRFAFIAVVNAIAAKQFHKEVAAKNWYCEPGAHGLVSELSPLMSIQSKSHVADVMVLQAGKDFSTSMLLQPLVVNETKTLERFTLLKLGNDRLFDFTGRCLDIPAHHD